MNGVTVSVQADGDGSEDCRAIAVGMAVERFFDMLEARLHRDAAAGKQRQLGRMTRKAFQRSQAVDCGKLADGIHPGVEI
jgi:hypothetical protein